MPDVIDISGGYDGGRRRGASAQELLARALLQQGTSAAPVRHPLEGLGRIAQALAGAYIGREAETARQRQTAADASTLGDYMGAIARGAPAVPAMAETPLSTGGMEADQVAVMPATPGRPGIAPGRDALAAALAGGAVPAVVARNMPMLASFAAGFEKEKPKAPEGMRFTPDGRLEPIPGFVEGKGAITAAGWKPVERVAAEAQAGWKPPERLRQEAEIRAQTEARFRAPTQEPLVEIADVNSPTGTRYVPRSQAVGQPGKPPSGMRVTTNPDGTVSIEQGRQGMGSKSVSDLEEKIRNATDGLGRVDQISKSFKPEYQQLVPRWNAMATAVKEKVGFEPDPESKAALADFSRFKREALNNLNLYIKEITGAAMSNAEADRITRALPNPGVGLMDGDSPTEFQAKMESVQRELRAAVGRANYALKNGLSPMSIPLDQVPQLMRERAQQIQGEVQITQPGMDAEAAKAEMKRRLALEFGLK